jgi:hypothetical protein
MTHGRRRLVSIRAFPLRLPGVDEIPPGGDVNDWRSTMRYLCLLYVDEDASPAPGTPEFGEVMAANMSARAAMAEAGVLVDSAPLHPVKSAATLRIRGAETLLTDGPFAELKEQLGGYYLLACATRDEALRWAATIPAARSGSVEVRQVREVQPTG